ncbi:hypothetical protein [Streptomyces sp. NPDC008122]|uniref:hypothetical protein n=1 Tax=Streptomyces sp. NPDC008122 TaxID=3364810 RepID=UPI0036E0FACC
MTASSRPILPANRLAAGAARLAVPAERFAAERLDAIGHGESPAVDRPPRVPFVCSRDSARSRTAAALLAHRAGDDVVVSSAAPGRPARSTRTSSRHSSRPA